MDACPFNILKVHFSSNIIHNVTLSSIKWISEGFRHLSLCSSLVILHPIYTHTFINYSKSLTYFLLNDKKTEQRFYFFTCSCVFYLPLGGGERGGGGLGKCWNPGMGLLFSLHSEIFGLSGVVDSALEWFDCRSMKNFDPRNNGTHERTNRSVLFTRTVLHLPFHTGMGCFCRAIKSSPHNNI